MSNLEARLTHALLFLIVSAFCVPTATKAQEVGPDAEWKVSTAINLGNSQFAPYYISALSHGKITNSKGWLLDAAIEHKLDTARRFSWEAALELCGGAASAVDYLKWNADGTTFTHPMRPSHIWIQQLYATVKYRSLFLMAGMKEYDSYLLDNTLTSGDLVESGNARPIPQVRVGFIDFQNIPFTRGWVQIQGELAYGKFTDNDWNEDFYSRGTSHINTGAFYIYRRLYLRSKPSEPFCFTFGMQAAGEIGGTTRWYRKGVLTRESKLDASFGKMLEMIIPFNMDVDTPGNYFNGNNLGSWDFMARYRLPWKGHEIKCYLQKPWEKGSSVGWRNGWDGLWGLEYSFGAGRLPIDAVLFEYIYTMNQSGPIHYAPHDYPGTTITSDISGGDQYYNNTEYNAYANYGVGIGSPFLKAPVYNTDGYPQYTDNRVKGFHLAARGHLSAYTHWKIALSYRQAFGDGRVPRTNRLDDFSWLIESGGSLPRVPGLELKGMIAMDRGSLLGNNFGVLVSATYKGNFNFKRK